MKKTLLLLLLLITGISKAQIVNIPNAAFKNSLITMYNINAVDINGNNMSAIDSNNDDEIQVSEAIAVGQLVVNLATVPNTSLTSIEGIEAFVNLKKLDCSYLPITSVDLSTLLQLEIFKCQGGGGLINIIMPEGGLPELQEIWVHTNQLTNIDLTGMSKLKTIDLMHNNLTEIDLSDSPLIQSLGFSENVEYINLKNGNLQINLFGNSGDLFMCVDEGEEEYLLENFPSLFLNNSVQISSYCSFTPGGNYNTIVGGLSFDANNNGCENGESIVAPFGMHITDGTNSGATYSNNGNYNFYTQSGSFVITPILPSGLFIATPASATINLATVDNSTTTQNFCLTANGVHPDLAVIIVPVVRARPGFDAVYKIVYGNKGNQVLSGSVAFNYDDAVLDYVSATTAPASTATGTLTWDFTNLKPFEYKAVTVTLNANGPMETPAVNIDDVLAFSATITPLTGDETPLDNLFEFNQIVVGSLDPNDITCLEGETVNSDKIGEYLHYTINFENTGTAPAEFIVVKDMIDTAQFDVSTLQLVDASHNVEVRVTGNKAEFIFDNINLAGAGKGNVVFKIKTLNSLAVNDDVTQNANIYFDYNWPIETNDATTVFGVLSNDSFQKDLSVKVYPNPAVSVVNFTAATEIQSVQLYDAQGRVLETLVSGNENSVRLDMSNRASGLYFIKVITEQGSKVEKIIKK